MGRARRARRIASSAAYGGGGLAALAGALGAAGYGLIRAEAAVARRLIGRPFDDSPDDNGLYGHGPGEPVELLMLGDSTAAGLGTDERSQTIGAILASGVAALSGRRVRLTNVAVVGAESSGLEVQVANALDSVASPDVAVILIGANDVTHRIERATAVRHLEHAVRRLLATGSHVVVGTCPDLGTIEPVPQPLRWLARRWSRDLAAALTVAVVEAGGLTVSLADMLGPEFETSPRELFSLDRFHPSAAGYARVAAALLPSVVDSLGLWAGGEPGAEVSGAELGGAARGPRGRWATLLRRRQPDVPAGPAPDVEAQDSAGDEAPAVEPSTHAATQDRNVAPAAVAHGDDHTGVADDPDAGSTQAK